MEGMVLIMLALLFYVIQLAAFENEIARLPQPIVFLVAVIVLAVVVLIMSYTYLHTKIRYILL